MHQQRQRAEAEHAAVGTEGAVTWWQDERLVVGGPVVNLLCWQISPRESCTLERATHTTSWKRLMVDGSAVILAASPTQ